MAKIKDFEIKNIVQFKGHELESLEQGDVYYKGEKIGFFSEDMWGGEGIFHDYRKVNIKELMVDIKEWVKNNYIFAKFPNLEEYYNINMLMEDILRLTEIETDFKKAKKEKWEGLLLVDSFKRMPKTYAFRNSGLKKLVARVNTNDEDVMLVFREDKDFFIN